MKMLQTLHSNLRHSETWFIQWTVSFYETDIWIMGRMRYLHLAEQNKILTFVLNSS